MAEPAIRLMDGLEEYQACVRLQEETWGDGFSERVPVSLLEVVQRIGGVVAGAWDEDGTLLGFVFGLTGLEDGEPVHWSDMLAVRPELRDGGLGRRLKLFQRRVCLERGIRRMRWTFDPLEARNGWLNLGRLGASAREYVIDMYGTSDSPLHRGLGTDRLVVTWLLDSPRVEARLAGRDLPPSPEDVVGAAVAFEVSIRDGLPRPESVGPADDPNGILVPVPSDLQKVRAADPALASAWRRATRSAFVRCLEKGWEVGELVPAAGAVSHYLLRPGGGRPRPTP